MNDPLRILVIGLFAGALSTNALAVKRMAGENVDPSEMAGAKSDQPKGQTKTGGKSDTKKDKEKKKQEELQKEPKKEEKKY